jgi:heptosyltransferase-2/heptosyltransferase-3
VARPDHWWGALLVAAAGVPIRVGVATPETRPLLTHALAERSEAHAAQRALDLVRLALQSVGALEAPIDPAISFRIGAAARQQATGFWSVHDLEGQRVAAIQPAAGASLKSWPVERWAVLADVLQERGFAVLLVGAPEDAALLAAIRAAATRPSDLALAHGQPLDVSAALYQRAMVLIAPDSGAAHLAAAVGVPTVRLYGPASASTFGPWPRRADQVVLSSDRLACVPCEHLEAPPCGATSMPACMLALEVQEVLNVVERLTGQG